LEHEIMDRACALVKQKIGEVPRIALVLGSGLGSLADKLENRVSIPYSEIPGFPVSTAPGHASRLVCGTLNETPILMFQGRFHHYEGYKMEQIAYPVRFLKKLGCETLILTNAAGGVNRSYVPGDLMIISDHINMSGQNPLIGPNDEYFGPRFPDLTKAYNRELRVILKDAAASLGLTMKEGVYAWMTGPSFETPAEIRMLDNMGADAIGMSTVPEVITAVHAGMSVVGISCISNMAAGILDQPITSDEVMEIGQQVSKRFSALISKFVSLLGERKI
jgi:purine-nucleoside phosphorylase